jgi:hypothetical protein
MEIKATSPGRYKTLTSAMGRDILLLRSTRFLKVSGAMRGIMRGRKVEGGKVMRNMAHDMQCSSAVLRKVICAVEVLLPKECFCWEIQSALRTIEMIQSTHTYALFLFRN